MNTIKQASESLKNYVDWEWGISRDTKEKFGTKQGLVELKRQCDWFIIPLHVKNEVLEALK